MYNINHALLVGPFSTTGAHRTHVAVCAPILAALGPSFIEALLWLYRSHGNESPPPLPPSLPSSLLPSCLSSLPAPPPRLGLPISLPRSLPPSLPPSLPQTTTPSP